MRLPLKKAGAMATNDKAPLGDGAPRDAVTGFAGSAGAVSAADYTMGSPLGILQHRCPQLVTWLRCHACHRGFFATAAPRSQPCPACSGGRMQTVTLWDLAHEAAPAGMLRCGEV